MIRQLLHSPLDYLFRMPQWNIGVAACSMDDVLQNGELPEINWWKEGPASIFCADPFILGGDILFERMNRWRGKADIWLASPDGLNQRRFVSSNIHLSYPCAVSFEGRHFLIYESSARGSCEIGEFCDHTWKVIARIEQPIVDGTLLHLEGKWWVFGTLYDGSENSDLHIWSAPAVEGPWVPHRANPIKRDASSARPAGAFCWSRQGLIRPSQDCSQVYGGGLVLCRVERLDEEAYEETVVMRLKPDRIYDLGIHTINGDGAFLVVDGKRNRFHPLAALLRWHCRA